MNSKEIQRKQTTSYEDYSQKVGVELRDNERVEENNGSYGVYGIKRDKSTPKIH